MTSKITLFGVLVLMVFAIIFSVTSTIGLNARIESAEALLKAHELRQVALEDTVKKLNFDYEKRIYAEQDPANTGNIRAYEME